MIDLQARSNAITDKRWTVISIGIAAAFALVVFWPHTARAASFAVGQRVRCDIYFNKPGTVIAFHQGETFNGHPAGSGYFYRIRVDGLDPEGQLCKAEDMKAEQAPTAPAVQPPAAVVQRPATAPTAPARTPQVAQPAAAGPGRFGTTRTPRMTCPMVRSMPNAEQIKMLVQCDDEQASNNNLIYLDVNLSVQAGATRRYTQFADGYATTIDTNAPVLPIRGSVDSYQCAPLSRYTNKGTTYDTDNSGKNCAISPIRQTQGTCYRTTLGNWLCHLAESGDTAKDRLNQPPPA
jgi:hypothetical protein